MAEILFLPSRGFDKDDRVVLVDVSHADIGSWRLPTAKDLLSAEWVGEALRTIEPGIAWVLNDSCRAGDFNEKLAAAYGLKNIVTMAAGEGFQFSHFVMNDQDGRYAFFLGSYARYIANGRTPLVAFQLAREEVSSKTVHSEYGMQSPGILQPERT